MHKRKSAAFKGKNFQPRKLAEDFAFLKIFPAISLKWQKYKKKINRERNVVCQLYLSVILYLNIAFDMEKENMWSCLTWCDKNIWFCLTWQIKNIFLCLTWWDNIIWLCLTWWDNIIAAYNAA